jgi:riboflavin biosynthesis pyrimidine reductase
MPSYGLEGGEGADTIAVMMRRLLGPSGALQGSIGTSLEDLEAEYASPSPWLRANLITTMDGVVDLGGVSGGLGGPVDKELFVAMRAQSDAVMVGVGTATAENYGPAWLRPEARHRRLARGQAELPRIVLVTASGRVDPTSRLFVEHRDEQPQPPAPVIVTCRRAGAEPIQRLGAVATVLVCGDDDVDLVAAKDALAGLGLRRLVCEGGPTLLGTLLDAGMIDELCLTHAPMLAGPGHPILLGAGLHIDRGPARFALTHLADADGMLFARYRPLGEAA